MKTTTQTYLFSGLQAAINGENLCVQTWLGFGDTLFLGLGTSVMAHVPPGGKHPIPPYEIQTELSDWIVYRDLQVIGSSHDDPRAQEASDILVGKIALEFRFSPDVRHLSVVFADGIKLEIVPYEKFEEGYDDFDIWNLRLTDGRYLTVCNDLTIKVQEGDCPPPPNIPSA